MRYIPGLQHLPLQCASYQLYMSHVTMRVWQSVPVTTYSR